MSWNRVRCDSERDKADGEEAFRGAWRLRDSPDGHSNPAAESAVPTFIQEAGESARPIEDKIREFAALPDLRLSAEEVDAVRQTGDNTCCMTLKGDSKRHPNQRTPRRTADARGSAGTGGTIRFGK